jgi:membrane-bound serine protease (ClpP class)
MIPALIVISLFFAGVMSLVMKAQMRKRQTGREGMIGAEGEAVTDIHEMGKVFVHGEYWNAWSDRAVEKGKKVRVVEVAALKLKIEEL